MPQHYDERLYNPMAVDTYGKAIPQAPWWAKTLASDMGRLAGGIQQGAQSLHSVIMGDRERVVNPDGSVQQFSPAMMDTAASLAGSAMGGGLAIPKPSNSLGIFGGVMAKTADKKALKKAQEMAEKGADREQIWQETGWFKGTDGKWRFEIPENAAVGFGAPGVDALYEGKTLKAGDPMGRGFVHRDMYEAYPELGGVEITGEVPAGYGGMSWGGRIGVTQQPRPKMNSTGLHEFQHEVQNLEGFAKGTNLGQARELLDDASIFSSAWQWRREMERTAAANPQASVAEIEQMVLKDYEDLGLPKPSSRERNIAKDTTIYPTTMLKNWARALDAVGMASPPGLWSESAVRKAYAAHAGEVEARNVQARQNMTAAERRAKAPWSTQDTPDERQIIRF